MKIGIVAAVLAVCGAVVVAQVGVQSKDREASRKKHSRELVRSSEQTAGASRAESGESAEFGAGDVEVLTEGMVLDDLAETAPALYPLLKSAIAEAAGEEQRNPLSVARVGENALFLVHRTSDRVRLLVAVRASGEVMYDSALRVDITGNGSEIVAMDQDVLRRLLPVATDEMVPREEAAAAREENSSTAESLSAAENDADDIEQFTGLPVQDFDALQETDPGLYAGYMELIDHFDFQTETFQPFQDSGAAILARAGSDTLLAIANMSDGVHLSVFVRGDDEEMFGVALALDITDGGSEVVSMDEDVLARLLPAASEQQGEFGARQDVQSAAATAPSPSCVATGPNEVCSVIILPTNGLFICFCRRAKGWEECGRVPFIEFFIP